MDADVHQIWVLRVHPGTLQAPKIRRRTYADKICKGRLQDILVEKSKEGIIF